MSLHPVILLVLVLCLGWKINTQEGSLPDITIFPNSSLMISQGTFVTVVCSYSDKHDLYNMVRLEKDGSTFMEKSTEPYKTEDEFEIGPVNETITGHYSCIYSKGITWSERSKTLELKVIKENVIQTPAPGPTSDTSWLKTYSIYIFTVVSVIFLLCLSALLFCFLRHRQKKQGLPNNKRQQQRPEERLNLATNGLEMTPDPSCRRPSRGDVYPAGPSLPHTEGSRSCDLTEHRYG